MLNIYLRLFKFSPLLLLVYLCYVGRQQVLFEHFLTSSSITFDDFPLEYAEALIAAKLENKNPDYTWPPVFTPQPEVQKTIPPTIHFIWFQNLYHEHLDISSIPTSGSDAPDICRDYNPGFEIHIWNATTARALIQEYYAWFLPTYDTYRYPIQRVDAFKYFVLWHYGGIYMDLDIACRRPLDPLLAFPAWYPKASPLGVNNDLMASRARHPLVGLMLDELAPRNKNLFFPYLTIFWSTGPQFTSDVLRVWLFKLRGQQKISKKSEKESDMVYVLPQEFYSEAYTFFGHSPGGTWHGKDVAVILWLVDRPWLFALVPTVIFITYLGALKVRVLRKTRDRKFAIRTA